MPATNVRIQDGAFVSPAGTTIKIQRINYGQVTPLFDVIVVPDTGSEYMDGIGHYEGFFTGIALSDLDVGTNYSGTLTFTPSGGTAQSFTAKISSLKCTGSFQTGGPLWVQGQWKGKKL